MNRTCAVLAIWTIVSAPALAARPGRPAAPDRGGDSGRVVLERSSGKAYDVITLRTGHDTIQALVSDSDGTTIRLNGRQQVLSPRAREAWARGGWEALGADDRAKVGLLFDMANDPEELARALSAMQQGNVPDVDSLEWMYGTLAPGGCGIGGRCHSEAWEALSDFLSCSGSAGVTVITAFGAEIPATLFGGMLTLANCGDWIISQEAFERCCYGPGRPGGDENDDPEPCDHCLPPDVDGPNPECCYEDEEE